MRRKLKRAVLAVCAALVVWVGVDLAWPCSFHLRQFDPAEVGRLETGMWRAYYRRERVELFGLLSQMLRGQYGFPFWRSQVGAYYAAHGAFTFKKGSERSDYEQALPDLRRFYGMIRRGSDIAFDADKAAQIELEWWIAHRAGRRPDLAQQLGALQAEIYRLPADRFVQHASARAEAMTIRDARASNTTEEDWGKIEKLLNESWTSLHRAVQ